MKSHSLYFLAEFTVVILCTITVPNTWGADDKPLAATPPERLEAALNSGRISPLLKIEAKLAAAKTEFDPLEPIQLEIDVQSLSKERGHGLATARFRGDPPEGDYRVCPIKVFDGNGDAVPTTRFAEEDLLVMGRGITNRVPSVHLQPGEHYRCKLTANMVRDMTHPGVYTILVEFPFFSMNINDNEGKEVLARAEPIKVKVRPDPNRPRDHRTPTPEGKTKSPAKAREHPIHPEQIDAARDPRRLSTDDFQVFAWLVRARSEYEPLEPIRLHVGVRYNPEMRDLASQPTRILHEDDYRNFSIKVFDSNGELIPATRFAEENAGNEAPPEKDAAEVKPNRRLGPKDYHRGILTANLVREMTSPDEYTILVEYPLHKTVVIDGKDIELVSQSEPIKVKVLPDDRRSPRFWNRPTRAQFDAFKRGQWPEVVRLQAEKDKKEAEDAKRRREQDQQTPPREPTSQRETP